MAGNRIDTLASLSKIPYRFHICKFAHKNKAKGLLKRNVAEVPFTATFKYFFQIYLEATKQENKSFRRCQIFF